MAGSTSDQPSDTDVSMDRGDDAARHGCRLTGAGCWLPTKAHNFRYVRSIRTPGTGDSMFKILSICRGGGCRYCRTDPPHPKRNSNGLYPLHRVLMENKLGRILGSDEIVHHKDEDKKNDDIDNLELMGPVEHAKHHAQKAEVIELICACGRSFFLKPHQLRLRKKRSKRSAVYCSRKCGGTKW